MDFTEGEISIAEIKGWRGRSLADSAPYAMHKHTLNIEAYAIAVFCQDHPVRPQASQLLKQTTKSFMAALQHILW